MPPPQAQAHWRSGAAELPFDGNTFAPEDAHLFT